MPQEQETYPVSIKGELTEPPSNALWLIKWLLAIPHLIILVFFVGSLLGGVGYSPLCHPVHG